MTVQYFISKTGKFFVVLCVMLILFSCFSAYPLSELTKVLSASEGSIAESDLLASHAAVAPFDSLINSRSVAARGANSDYFPLNYSPMKAIWISQFDLALMRLTGTPDTTETDATIRNGTQSMRSEQQYTSYVKQMLDNVVSMGFNTVIIQVRPYADSFYPSVYYPWSVYMTGAYGVNSPFDPFEILVQQSHARNLSIHAWINPMRGMFENEISAINVCYPIGKWYKNQSVYDRYLYTHAGRYYLNISIPEVRRLIIDGAAEIARYYDIDGVHMDDYFYVSGTDDGAEFSVSGYSDLAAYRKYTLNQLVSGIYAAVKYENPNIIFGISPAGNINTVRNSQYADVDTWCSMPGYIDYIMPQIYFGLNHSSFSVSSTYNTWKAIVKYPGVKYIPGYTFHKAYAAGNGQEDAYAGAGKREWIDSKDVIKRSLEFNNSQPNACGFAIFSYKFIYHPTTGVFAWQTSAESANAIPVIKKLSSQQISYETGLGNDFYATVSTGSRSTGYFLTHTGSSVIFSETKTNSSNQTFRFQRLFDGSFKITSMLDGKCLDVAAAADANGTTVQSYEDNSTAAQRFVIIEYNNKYIFKLIYSNKQVFDRNISLNTLTTYEYWGGDNQSFYINVTSLGALQYTDIGTETDGYILNSNDDMFLTNDASNSVTNAAKAYSDIQKWRFTRQADGSYEIKNASTSQCLDISNASDANGSAVGTYNDNETQAQRFFIYKQNASYYIRPVYSTNKVITASSGRYTINYYTGADNQGFTLLLSSISSLSIKTKPNKEIYFAGDNLDKTGLVLNSHYENGGVDTVPASKVICSPNILSIAGLQTIIATYNKLSTIFYVTVVPVMITDISINTYPRKAYYFTGDTLDFSGLTLTATYNNGKTAIISSGFTCSVSVLNTTGTQSVTVSYGGKSTTFNVSVAAVALTTVTVKTLPSKVSYFAGDTLDLTGLTLTAAYNNGKSDVVSSGFDCSVSKLEIAGTQAVIVSYQGKEAVFDVSVLSNIIEISDTQEIMSISQGKINIGSLLFTAESVCDLFRNSNFIQITDCHGNIKSGDSRIGTGDSIQLTDGNTVYDTLTVVIKGDTDGDGDITVTDYMKIKSSVINREEQNDIYFLASDIDSDGRITLVDYLRVKLHFEMLFDIFQANA